MPLVVAMLFSWCLLLDIADIALMIRHDGHRHLKDMPEMDVYNSKGLGGPRCRGG